MKSPLLGLAACFALGIALEPSKPASVPGAPLVAGCAVCLFAGLVALCADQRTLSFLLALIGFVTAGASAARLFDFRFPPRHVSHLAIRELEPSEPLRLEGRLVSTPYRNAYGLHFDVEVTRLERGGEFRPAAGRVRLSLPGASSAEATGDALRLQYGDSIRTPVVLRRPRVYQNPGSFDFRRWVESIEDIGWLGTVKPAAEIEKLPGSGVSSVGGLLERTRRRLSAGIDGLYPPWSAEGRNGAVLKAVLLGDRSALNSDTLENFRKAGLYHLLVIAGLHVALLAMLAALLLRRLRLGELWRTLGVLLFLLAYAALVEQRASTLRATIMISVYLAARLFYRQYDALNGIGLAALLLLVHRPAWLLEAGFELSFSAALLIVALVVPILEQTTEPYRRALGRLDDVDLDSALAPRQAQFRLDLRDLIKLLKARLAFLAERPALAATLVTAPARLVLWTANILLFSAILQLGLLLPMAETFHRVSYAGVGLNALAIPVMTLLLAAALPAVLVATVAPALGPWLGSLLAPVMRLLFALTDLPNLPAWLSYRVPGPPPWVAWGFALAAVAAAWSVRRRARAFWASLGALAVFALLISLYPFAPRLPQGALEVSALDCGGGGALFVVLPDQTTLLAGACGGRSRSGRDSGSEEKRWDPGEEIVSPYLWSRGVRRIDILVVTGAHLAGFAAVMRNFHVGEFWQTANSSTPALQALLEQVRRRGVALRELRSGDLVMRGDTSLRVVWSPPPAVGTATPPHRRRPVDDASAILRIAHDQASLLVSGNTGAGAEEELARSAAPVESHVFAIVSRGLRPSVDAEFLARVSPRVVLWAGESGARSDGRAPEGLDQLRAAGVRFFRTDLDGAVTVEMKGTELSVHTYRTAVREGITAASAGATLSVP